MTADNLANVHIVGINVGSFRLRKEFITKKRLSDLLGYDHLDFFFVNQDGDEVPWESLEGGNTYTAVTEKDVERMDKQLTHEEIFEIQKEVALRQEKMQKARIALIKELYVPKHTYLYTFDRSMLHPEFVKHFDQGPEHVISWFHKETPTLIYSFPMFTNKFCDDFVEEVENFENSGLPVSRPNSMNNYGVILDEIGFTPFLTTLRETYIQPVSKLLYPDVGTNLDCHHGFIVTYKIGQDVNLDFHFDDAEVTLNLCLGSSFVGGSLFFKGLVSDPSTHNEEFELEHEKGKGVLHVGKHRHGANPIESGTRYNLILWCRDSTLCRAGCEHEHDHDHDHEHEHEHHH